jgi:hypothetical protein
MIIKRFGIRLQDSIRLRSEADQVLNSVLPSDGDCAEYRMLESCLRQWIAEVDEFHAKASGLGAVKLVGMFEDAHTRAQIALLTAIDHRVDGLSIRKVSQAAAAVLVARFHDTTR